MRKKIYMWICLGVFFLANCSGSKVAPNKPSNRLLDEFRVDEYREFVVLSIKKHNSDYSDVAMYNQEKKRYVFVKIPNWLAEYWQEGDTIR